MSGPFRRTRSLRLFFPHLKASDRVGWRGRVDRWLSRIGPVTRSSPIRRFIQIACLVLFLHLFLYVCWPYAERFSATAFSDKEWLAVDSFLRIDPLVGLSTVLAGRYLDDCLWWTAGILVFCVVFPRAFCGYLCPLGTLIDAFDWLVGRHVWKRRRENADRKAGWVHVKYYLLVAVLVSSLLGVLTSGFVSAIPVLTRGLLFTVGRVQLWLLKGWNHLGPVDGTFYLSVALFVGVFLCGLLGQRFWCRCLCPSGALFSVLGACRLSERRVDSRCVSCRKCVEVCPFDAIKEDFSTRPADCTLCQTCGGVCPTHAIDFVWRWSPIGETFKTDIQVAPRPLSRRGFLSAAAIGSTAAAATVLLDTTVAPPAAKPLRPPGSVPEGAFLDLCIRCGECFKVCPGPVLHPAGFEYGVESLWTPVVRPELAGCHQDCNFCTEVCPTGAIQPLPLSVKRTVHMGLAKINAHTCLPFRDQDRVECDLCYVECTSAGYDAIEMRDMEITLDPPPPPGVFSDLELEEMSRIKVPFVNRDACVGCGICQYRCHTTYVLQKCQLTESAVVIRPENEDRLFSFLSVADASPTVPTAPTEWYHDAAPGNGGGPVTAAALPGFRNL